MLTAPCYIMSDAHLGFAPREVERSVVSFFRYVATTGGSLVVNGDLFEFWFEWRTVVPRSGFRAAAALADVVEAGVPVLFIAGNHDCWGGEIFTRDIGVDYRFGPWDDVIAGWRAHIEHGDGLRPAEDRRYRMIRPVLRSKLAMRAYRWLHPDLATPLATHSSDASRTYGARDGGRGLRDAAIRASQADPSAELIVFGHSHVATLERLPTGAVYGNAGSWLDQPSYLYVTDGRVALREWNGSAESADLHAFDRAAKEALPEL